MKLAKIRAPRVREFMEQNSGYYRHLSSLRPQRLRYEADDEDIQSLSFYYPTEITDFMASEQLAKHPLVREYENFVEHVETTEKYKEREPNFSALKLHRLGLAGSSTDSGSVAKNFMMIWRRKCILLKRLLFRQFWRFADSNRDFGPAERRFVAFVPRDKKSSRTNTFRKDLEVKTKLEEIRQHNELALTLINLVLRREELKLLRMQSDWLALEKPSKIATLKAAADTCLARVKSLTEGIAAKHKLELPAKTPALPPLVLAEARAELPRPSEHAGPKVDNDLASFVCSLAAAMHEYQLFFSDIQKAKFGLINRKIRYSKNAKCNVMVERRASLLVKREAPPLSVQRIRLVKRVLPRTNECFLTKVEEPVAAESQTGLLSPEALFASDEIAHRTSLVWLLALTERMEGARSLCQLDLLMENGAALMQFGEILNESEPEHGRDRHASHVLSDAKTAEISLQRMSFEEKFQNFVKKKTSLN